MYTPVSDFYIYFLATHKQDVEIGTGALYG